MNAYDETTSYWTLQGSTSAATVFSGEGVLHRIIVERGVSDATMTTTDISGNALNIGPTLAAQTSLPYGIHLMSGLMVTASGFTAGQLQVVYSEMNTTY